MAYYVIVMEGLSSREADREEFFWRLEWLSTSLGVGFVRSNDFPPREVFDPMAPTYDISYPPYNDQVTPLYLLAWIRALPDLDYFAICREFLQFALYQNLRRYYYITPVTQVYPLHA